MKKFIFTLVLLIIIAATVFYFGYVSFRIPEGSYGVVLTKTNGYDHPVLSPGSFQWMWQGLLPTNLRLFHIRLQEQTLSLDFNGELPSAGAYENYADAEVDFALRVKALFRYRLGPQSLPQIFQRAGINAETSDYSDILLETYQVIETDVKTLFADALRTLVEDENFDLGAADFEEALKARITREIPQLQDFDISLSDYSFPDMDLYRRVKNNYLAYLERSHEIAVQALEAASSARTREISRIEVLKEYGALLQEYPVLLEIFRDQSDEPLIVLPETD